MNGNTKELIDTLLAISVVAKRLATKLAKEEKYNGAHDEDHKRTFCPYCRSAGIHGKNNRRIHKHF